MITVLASITIKPGFTEKFISIFNANVPAVLKEEGCIEYYPTVDIDSGLPTQQMNDRIVTIVEKWDNLEALELHLNAPHMVKYKVQVEEMVENVSLKILQPAL